MYFSEIGLEVLFSIHQILDRHVNMLVFIACSIRSIYLVHLLSIGHYQHHGGFACIIRNMYLSFCRHLFRGRDRRQKYISNISHAKHIVQDGIEAPEYLLLTKLLCTWLGSLAAVMHSNVP